MVLNGSSEDLDLMRTKLEARQARLKAERKARNDAKCKGKVETIATSSNSQDIAKKSELSSKIHDLREETKSSANGEEGSQKSKLQNGKSDPKLLLKFGSKPNGMLICN